MVEGGVTSRGEIVEDVTLLSAQRVTHGKHPFGRRSPPESFTHHLTQAQVPPETLDQTLGMLTRAIYRKDQYIGFALGTPQVPPS